MSKRAREQLVVFEELKKRRITQLVAAHRLGVTTRWVREKLRRYQSDGARETFYLAENWNFLCSFDGAKATNGFVVYGGSEHQSRAQGNLVGWQEAANLIDRVHQEQSKTRSSTSLRV